MPICAKEEASGSPAKSSAASAIVESFIFIFRCSIELKRETQWAAKYSNEPLPELHRSAIATLCNRFKGENARICWRRSRSSNAEAGGVTTATPEEWPATRSNFEFGRDCAERCLKA